MKKNCAIFLDRDGVINKKAAEGAYITTLREFELLPGAVEAITCASRSQYTVFVVTNQRGVARGLVSLDDLQAIHASLLRAVQAAGGEIRQIYICPHDYAEHCNCRKPKPGMLLQAQQEHGISLEGSWMVGDSASDVAAGQAALCRTVMIGKHLGNCGANLQASDLPEAVQKILSHPEI